MQCPKCGHENRNEAKFCEECGEKLQSICPKCGAELRPNAKFCDECGTNITESTETNIPTLEEIHSQSQDWIPDALAQKYLAAEQQATGENRPITALFADISGFTTMSQTNSSESMFQLVQNCFRQLVSIVANYEGSISGFRGDGLLAMFGAPILHENDAERAILAAMDMRRIMQDRELKVSIGINTAMMTVGEIQTQLHREYTAYGTDINLAKRLQEASAPGQILVGAGTYRLTRFMFDFEAIPELSVKGFTQSVTAYSVQHVKEHPEKLRGIEGLRARMIGREREYTDLRDAIDEWLLGHGQMASIIGEAGIGKSRLALELKEHLKDKDIQCYEGRSVSIGQTVSYWPFLDILRTYMNLSDEDTESQIVNKLREYITDLFPQRWEEILPFLGRLFSVKFGDQLDDKLIYLTPEQLSHQTLMRLRDVFIAMSHRKPLLLILEDMHWSDDLSLDLLALLMDELATNPLMVLCIYRPDKEHRILQMGNVASRKCPELYTEITLKKLSPVQSRELVESLLEIENLPEATKEMILSKSEGNPFFIEEVIRYLIDQYLVYHEDDRWKARREIEDIDVPDTIQSMLLSRVDRLASEAKYVLQCASVIGRLFRYRILEHLARHERNLESHLSQLEERELINEERTIPELEYAFRHALMQEATYQSILEQRRQEFHHQVAVGIESLYGQRIEEYYEELAYHYSRSQDIGKAIEYLQKAGEKALGNYANETAVSYFKEAMQLIPGFPDGAQRTNLELGLQINIIPPLVALNGYGSFEVEKAAKRALDICRQIAQSNITGNEREIDQQLFLTLTGLGALYNARAELKTARELGEQALDIAQRVQDTALLSQAHNSLGSTLYFLGEFAPSREHFERSIALYNKQKNRSLTLIIGSDSAVASLCYESSVLWLLGYFDQEHDRISKGLELARELSHPNSLGLALGYASSSHLLYYEWQSAQDLAEEAIAFCTEYRLPFWLAMATVLRGVSIVEQGQIEEGINQIGQAINAWRGTGAMLGMTYFLSKLAIAYGRNEQFDKGFVAIEEALDTAQRTGDQFWKSELYIIKGQLMLMKGESLTQAIECFQEAIKVAQLYQSKSFELRATMSLSRLYKKQGRSEEAHRMLQKIYGWFTEGFDTKDLQDAKALLEELS